MKLQVFIKQVNKRLKNKIKIKNKVEIRKQHNNWLVTFDATIKKRID